MKKIISTIESPDILTITNNKLDQLFLDVAQVEVFPKGHIKSFDSAAEAMDYLFKEEYLPDLIILNLNIGELSGKAFTTLIKNTRKLDNIPLVIISTIGYESELLRLGADDFYKMPSSVHDLIELLGRVKNKWLSKGEFIPVKMMAGIIN